jgi:hypothetical protein
MNEMSWTEIVAIVTGVVGSITGISGAILGYVSYRRSNSIKSLDLRIELKKALNLLFESISGLEEQLKECDRSRKAVASATGSFNSVSMEKWNQNIARDKEALSCIAKDVPETNNELSSLDHQQLEHRLVHIHQLQTKIDSLNSRYEREMAKDDDQRRFIREQAHARFKNNT